MEYAFLANGPALIDAALAGPVITPNERLAREVSRYLAAAPRLEGHPVICRSWQGWMRGLYERLNRRGERPRLLSPAGLALLVSGLDGEQSELQRPLIEDAWTISHHFGVTPSANSTPEEAFRDWHAILQSRLHEQHCITSAELEAVLLDQSPPCSTVTLAGFDVLNPAQQHLLETWCASGMNLHRLDTPQQTPTTAIRIEVPTAADELRTAAWWARGILDEQPDARIGVLVSGLEARRDAVLRQFGAIIDPWSGSDSPLFDVSGGTRLSTTSLWRDCDLLLQSFERPVASVELLRLLRSPHLRLDVEIEPGSLAALSTLPGLAAITGHHTLVALCELHAAAAECTHPAQHLDTIRRLLDLAGWAHSGMGTTRFQIQQATAGALQSFAAETALAASSCSFAVTLRQLNSHLAGVVHAPERQPARLRIMGYLETPGLAFTHLWVSGASESALPGPARPNPLLSTQAMRTAGVQRMDARSELAFTKQLTQLWRHQTGYLVVSHAALETGEHLSGSTLFADLPLLNDESLPWSKGPAHAWLMDRRDASQPWVDTAVTRLSPQRFRGGTALLANQASCSFRAFACHRLNLSEPDQPHDLLDPLERGSLLHGALEELMRQFGSRTALASATASDFSGALSSAFAALGKDLPTAFIEAETARLLEKLLAWQALETARPEFGVRHVEHKIELDLAGYRIGLKFDRIDEIDGKLIIIDYKSGAPQSFGIELTELPYRLPQLPAYAAAMPEAEGVFYLHFKDAPEVKGLSSESVNSGGLGKPRIVDSWKDTVAGWQESLITLAQDFAGGPVIASPADPKLCTRCHIRPICRIDASSDDEDDDDDAEDAA